MRHIRQPDGSNMCGQACVAMLGNMTIYEAVEFVGKKGCTTTKDMAGALRALGFQCGDKLKRTSGGALPPLSACLVNVGFDKPRGTHWVIWNGKERYFYDPSFSYPVAGRYYHKKVGRITSFLEINRCRKDKA